MAAGEDITSASDAIQEGVMGKYPGAIK